MGMSVLTAIELGTNYPHDIKIETVNVEGKHAVLCYMLRDGDIHKLMLSSEPVFDTAEEAKQSMVDTAESCVKYVKNMGDGDTD